MNQLDKTLKEFRKLTYKQQMDFYNEVGLDVIPKEY